MKRFIAEAILKPLAYAADKQSLPEPLMVRLLDWTLKITERARGTEIVRNPTGEYGVILFLTEDRDPAHTILWEPPGQHIFDHTKIPANAQCQRIGDEIVFSSGFEIILKVNVAESKFSDDPVADMLRHGLTEHELFFNKLMEATFHRSYGFWIDHNGQGYAIPRSPLSPLKQSGPFTAITHEGVLIPMGERLCL